MIYLTEFTENLLRNHANYFGETFYYRYNSHCTALGECIFCNAGLKVHIYIVRTHNSTFKLKFWDISNLKLEP